MHEIAIGQQFERAFQIISHPRFLSRQGLGNEVPFFIDTYDPSDEFLVCDHIQSLAKRLQNEGIVPVVLPIYDIVIEMLRDSNRLDRLFEYEKRAPKTGSRRTFFGEMDKFTDPGAGKPLQTEIKRRLDSTSGYQVVLMHQLGTVFPYLRTHTLLNNLHSVITQAPLVTFFPGQYVSSDKDGFYLSLFGAFKGDYYRAFALADYIERGNISVDVT